MTVLCFLLLTGTSYGDATSPKEHSFKDDSSSSGFQLQRGIEQETEEIDVIQEHADITSYTGPATCIACHEEEAHDALNSVHMQWNGPTPDLINSDGEWLGKANRGINTFCTYAMSSGNTCFSCHVRADGNAPHAAEVTDVDCLMCHSDIYQRKLVFDPENTITVTNVDGDEQTYTLPMIDADGNAITVPDFAKMPPGTTMVDLARNVHPPTRSTCLRCHASAGGGDWTKRGDLGWSSVNPPITEDVHLSADGADLHCINCHGDSTHKIGGRGIDLRQTEAEKPTCQGCHTNSPHAQRDLNRHAQGQVSCQVCHIREFGKGGATEMSRNWLHPHWNPALCYGQGGFVGLEVKESFVKPEYVWFDGTSYVYNVGEVIEPDGEVYHLAKANGAPFDGTSSIVPIKRHWSIMAYHDSSNQMVPPAIMWMFMTGYFDLAVQKGMEEWNMKGNYSIVDGDAEMLISHGVEPSDQAPRCNECHDNSGDTPDGYGMLPFTELGYHQLPDSVISCTLCHEPKKLSWKATHEKHRDDVTCTSCHTKEPTGLVAGIGTLCVQCHERESWEEDSHKKHIEEGIVCTRCHTF